MCRLETKSLESMFSNNSAHFFLFNIVVMKQNDTKTTRFPYLFILYFCILFFFIIFLLKVTYRPMGLGVIYYFVVLLFCWCTYTCHYNKIFTYLRMRIFNEYWKSQGQWSTPSGAAFEKANTSHTLLFLVAIWHWHWFFS